jgi:phenylpyruvate tautomerase PptA (4-oxalocrotonate tautomerase family)
MICVYGVAFRLVPVRKVLSEVINRCMTEALAFPENKKAQRFFPMTPENFYYPEGRTDAYTVIEISLMAGRSTEAKKKLLHLLFSSIEKEIGIAPADIEITISESAPENWGFRGMTGDEATLNYRIDV